MRACDWDAVTFFAPWAFKYCEIVASYADLCHLSTPRRAAGCAGCWRNQRDKYLRTLRHVVTDWNARVVLNQVLNQRAVTVQESETVLHYTGGSFTLPSVIRLVKFVRIPYRHSIPLSRRALFARDGGKCVYCSAPAASIDHVIPRSRGGEHRWENVVSACHKCNHLKADKTLKEIGWRLRTIPREPQGAAWRILGTGRTDHRWSAYLEPYGVQGLTPAAASA